MKAKRVTDNLIQLDRARFVNAYLVREDDGFTLVDTTLSGAAEDIVKAARAAGGEIVRIALTHGHGDHSGSLDALRDLLGAEVPVSLGEADARIHAGEAPKTRGSWPAVATRPDQLLHGGERIGSLEVVANPGHTPGHVAFMDVRDRTLIAGGHLYKHRPGRHPEPDRASRSRSRRWGPRTVSRSSRRRARCAPSSRRCSSSGMDSRCARRSRRWTRR
jgi:glyoxylase-like metal-dependent hydrolase (beta-lactamase superfamily II)